MRAWPQISRSASDYSLGAVQEFDAAEGNELSSDLKTDIADCFLRLADLPTSALDRLSRYIDSESLEVDFDLFLSSEFQASDACNVWGLAFHDRGVLQSPCVSPELFPAKANGRDLLIRRKRLLGADYSKKHSDVVFVAMLGIPRIRYTSIRNDVAALLKQRSDQVSRRAERAMCFN